MEVFFSCPEKGSAVIDEDITWIRFVKHLVMLRHFVKREMSLSLFSVTKIIFRQQGRYIQAGA